MKNIILTLTLLLISIACKAEEIVLFSSVNCGPCRVQEAELNKDAAIKAKIIKLSIDEQKNFDLFKKFGLSMIPQIVKLDKDKISDKMTPGVHSVQEIKIFIEKGK